MFPKLEWSDWKLWSERGDIDGCHLPGVYRLAIGVLSELELKQGWNRVRYIGMTLQNVDSEGPTENAISGLKSRWVALNRSLNGGRGHSGGKRIFKNYGAQGLEGDVLKGKKSRNKLYVSAMPYDVFAGCEKHSPEFARKCGIIAYLEYAAFAQYSTHIQFDRPLFNVK